MSIISELFDKAANWLADKWEWVKDQWDDWTDNFVYYMDNFWDWFGDVFIIAIGVAIAAFVLGALGVLSWVWSGLTIVWGWISAGWAWIAGWATALYSYWEDFLAWLHWDDLKRLSDIAEVVSPEYKQAVDDLYSQIADVSEQLGLGSGFMLLALSDARNLILDATSLMGRSYDVSELAWVSSLTGYLGDFNEKAESFRDNPEGLILDIQSYFEPDIVTARTGFQKTLIDFMGTSIKGLGDVATKLVNLKDTMEQTILHLPEQISLPLHRKMDKAFGEFDTIMEDTIIPSINNVEAVTTILGEITGSHETQIGSIEGLMSNPGKMLGNIDSLPDIERLQQEAQITEISSRGYRTESEGRNEVIDNANKELVQIADALIKERKPPDFLQLEYEGEPQPAPLGGRAFVSWQVGDY